MNQNPQSISKSLFRIKSKLADKYITAQADVFNPKLILFDKTTKFSQQFYILPYKQSIFIIDKKTHKLITVSDYSDQNGAPLILKQKNNLNMQTLQIHQSFNNNKQDFNYNINSQKNQFVIFTFNGKCLDCCQQLTKNGTEIIQWQFHGSDNQKWVLQYV